MLLHGAEALILVGGSLKSLFHVRPLCAPGDSKVKKELNTNRKKALAPNGAVAFC